LNTRFRSNWESIESCLPALKPNRVTHEDWDARIAVADITKFPNTWRSAG
jgi:hypothetical protein